MKKKCHTTPKNRLAGAERIRLSLSGGTIHNKRGWPVASKTLALQAGSGSMVAALTIEVYLLTTQEVLFRVYHRIQPSDASSDPVRVVMDLAGTCATLDDAFAFLAGLDWPLPVAQWVRALHHEEAHPRWEQLVARGTTRGPRTDFPPQTRGAPRAPFRILAGSIIPG
ncbi:MAG TPA: hypothetical protein VGW38_25055 [Chloroflexota bacterium]|nr:hypothetical protein [Chloroflexota bacterium]